MNELRVSTVRLGNDADQIKSLIQIMERELNKMKDSVQQLNGMWDGITKKAFETAFQDDMRTAESVIRELKYLHNYEVQAKNKYEQCENQIENIIQTIRV